MEIHIHTTRYTHFYTGPRLSRNTMMLDCNSSLLNKYCNGLTHFQQVAATALKSSKQYQNRRENEISLP